MIEKSTRVRTVPGWISRWLPPSADPAKVREFASLAGTRFDEVQSIVFAPFPYGPDELLVVLSDDVPFVPVINGEIIALVPPDVRVTCFRHRELFELAIPGMVNPIMMDTYPISAFWLRYASELLYGADVREDIPAAAWTQQQASRSIYMAIDPGRQNNTISCVVRQDYSSLCENIKTVVLLSILAALLTRGEWHVEPESIIDRFLEAFPDFSVTIDQLEKALEAGSDEEAYHLLFVYDVFLRRMLKEMYV